MRFIFLLFSSLGLVTEAFSSPPPASVFHKNIEDTALLYFIEHTNPISGLTRDSANNFSATPGSNNVASMAATGFALAIVADAAVRGRVSFKFARDFVLRSLNFSQTHVLRQRGWFLHFVHWETGARVWSSEFSTIDTALFIAGALYASEVLGSKEIKDLTNKLYSEIDFNYFLTDDGALPDKKTLSLSYTQEQGFVPYQWKIYAEQMMLLILGLGHPTQPLPIDTWYAWVRQTNYAIPYGYIIGYDMPLFIHQYSHLYLNFDLIKDGFTNYNLNSQMATIQHRNMIYLQKDNMTFRSGFWGLSAGNSQNGYEVFSPLYFNSTVCIGCAVGSLMFAKDLVLTDIQMWLASPYKDRIWGRYGFVDSLDIEKNWFSKIVLGITVGPEYMSSVNSRSANSFRQVFSKIPAVQRAILKINQHHPTNESVNPIQVPRKK